MDYLGFLFLINCFYFGFDLVLWVIIFMLPTRFKGASMFYFFHSPKTDTKYDDNFHLVL